MLRYNRLRRTGLLLLLAALALLSLNACKSNAGDYTPPPATKVNAGTVAAPQGNSAQATAAPNATSQDDQPPAATVIPPTPQPTVGPEGYPTPAATQAAYPTS